MKPIVTVNILNFNRAHKLAYTLPSLIKTAGYDRWELSVTDNGSNDGSVKYLKEQFEKHDVFKRLILLPKNYGEGRGAAIGMECAKGEILVHSCNDLLYTRSGWLNETAIILQKFKEIICYSPVVTKEYGGDDIYIPIGYKYIEGNGMIGTEENFLKIKNTGGIPAFCVAIRKEDYFDLGGFKDCGSAMGAKMLRYGKPGMEYVFAEDVRKLAIRRGYKINGCACPYLNDSAATHDWNERGYRDTVHNYDKDKKEVQKKIIIMEK